MKKFLSLILAAMLIFGCGAALADYPEKAIEVLIPANPGGDTDTTVRAIAQSLTEVLGQPVVVTNMAGGSGSVARAMFGCAIIAVINNGMTLMEISAYWQKVVIGAIIILAVMLDMAQKGKEE